MCEQGVAQPMAVRGGRFLIWRNPTTWWHCFFACPGDRFLVCRYLLLCQPAKDHSSITDSACCKTQRKNYGSKLRSLATALSELATSFFPLRKLILIRPFRPGVHTSPIAAKIKLLTQSMTGQQFNLKCQDALARVECEKCRTRGHHSLKHNAKSKINYF